MSKYRKKPVEIEAMQWNGAEGWAQAIVAWINRAGGDAEYRVRPSGPVITILTLEGVMTASPGDFVIQGVQGEFYPCKPDIFAETYEASE